MKFVDLFKLIGIFGLLVGFGTFYPGGFAQGTLVTTRAGLVPIEQLCKGDSLVSLDSDGKIREFSIINATDYIANECARINVAGESFCVAPDQKFYLFNKNIWVLAKELAPSDLLQDYNGNNVCVEAIESVHKQQVMYQLSVDQVHTFFVSSHCLVVHNCEPATAAALTTSMAIVCPPAVPVIVIGEIIAGIFAGVGIYSAYKSSKRDKKLQEDCDSVYSNSGNWHDPQDEDKDVFESIKLRADKKLRHKRFGNFYRDPKTKLWWSRDRGGHGGSQYKVFKENSKGLQWFLDADEMGNQIIGKHKGPIGLFISYKEFIVCP